MNNLDKGLSSCAIFLDLAKAFDSVDHGILLRKLERYGIRGMPLQLLESYLSNRSQYVKLNNTKSALIDILFGVPQGSILGPLLFLIFINDLPEATKFYVKLFADDTFLCAQDTDFACLENYVNVELEKVFIWLASNKLTLNINKSKYMIVSKKRSIPKMKIMINDTELLECDSYKYLGVYIDKKLNWKDHIDHTCKKVAKACGALSKIRHSVDINTLKNVYHALLYSYLRYGIILWGNASASALQPLKTLVNKAIRIMTFIPPGSFELNPIYQELGLLNLSNIFNLETGKFMYKSMNNLLPVEIGNYFQIDPSSEQHSHYTRNQNTRENDKPRFLSRTKIVEKSLQYFGTELWYQLPQDIKSSESKINFKKQYKNHLLQI